MHHLQNPLSNFCIVSIDEGFWFSVKETIAQLKESGFNNLKSTKFIPGSELYGIVAGFSES
jgi:hypothetical protein